VNWIEGGREGGREDVPIHAEVILEDVELASHLTEDKDTGTLRLELGEELREGGREGGREGIQGGVSQITSKSK